MVKHFAQQPLPSSFMLLSILGFIFSAVVVWPANVTWGFTLTLTFGIWFVAAVVNFTHAEDEDVLDIHDSKQLLR